VGKDLVDGHADEFTAQRIKISDSLLEAHEFSGANRGEICGMTEEDEPGSLEIAWDVHRTVGGVHVEFGEGIAEKGHAKAFLLFHVYRTSLNDFWYGALSFSERTETTDRELVYSNLK
jgi:hypothetical protein